MLFLCFLAVFELMSDSLTATYIEPHQCPSHQSILHIQGPIPEIFTKNIENWRFWKTLFFWVGHFEFFFSKKKIFFCFIPMKTCQSLLVSKDGSKFWSSQTWPHYLTQTKHFDRECIRTFLITVNKEFVWLWIHGGANIP